MFKFLISNSTLFYVFRSYWKGCLDCELKSETSFRWSRLSRNVGTLYDGSYVIHKLFIYCFLLRLSLFLWITRLITRTGLDLFVDHVIDSGPGRSYDVTSV